MSDRELRERVELADRLRTHAREVAVEVTDVFFRRHPDWLERYGERGRKLGIEDATYHISFLAGAVESGAPASFEEYARWSSRMLASRGIAPAFVAENLAQVGRSYAGILSAPEHETVLRLAEAGAAACLATTAPASAEGEAETSDLATVRRLYVRAILDGGRKAAATLALEALREGHPAVDLYIQVFQEAQYEVGRLWEANRISVAQEHLATAITQSVLAQVYAELKPTDARRGNMLITGVQGELHQVGANMVADVLEMEGWDVRFLGTDMPHPGILDAIEEHAATVVGISATMLFNLPAVRRLTEGVRERFGTSTRLVLGGAAFRFAPHLHRELGADAVAGDLASAVELLCP